jgi:asparaginyl-tRNA synthetase
MLPIVSSLPAQIVDIYRDYESHNKLFQSEGYSRKWEIQGWVRDYRAQSDNAFVSVYDGSTSENFQLVCSKGKTVGFETLENLRGASIKASGLVVKSPAKGQMIEMVCESIEAVGLIQDKNSIIQAKTVQLETLRSYQHLRPRFRTFGYIYKIRSTLLKHIHNFFHSNGFYNLDPNIITTSDCEGAGEVFTITTIDTNEEIKKIINKFDSEQTGLSSDKNMINKNIYTSDFFHKQAYLTVSSQLQLEALCAGLSRVYTLNPSFRAEKSKTKRHLACFTHLEWEIAFIDIHQLMDFSEHLVKYVIGETLKECSKEYEELNKFVSKGIIDKLTKVIENPFERITYTQAIELIKENKDKILQTYPKEITESDIPKWGDDLGSYCEKFICDHIYSKPVQVYNYPIELKSFYMKANEDKITCQAVDLLCPQLGELIGSSIREDSYEKLLERMDKKNMDKSVLQWYVDLRKGGGVRTGGAGLGFDRLVNFSCLMDGNIRDVVPFPVSYEECEY